MVPHFPAIHLGCMPPMASSILMSVHDMYTNKFNNFLLVNESRNCLMIKSHNYITYIFLYHNVCPLEACPQS